MDRAGAHRRALIAGAGLLRVLAGFGALHLTLRDVHLHKVGPALALTALSYLAITGYDAMRCASSGGRSHGDWRRSPRSPATCRLPDRGGAPEREPFKMKEHSRHASVDMVAGYVRERFREHAGEGFL